MNNDTKKNAWRATLAATTVALVSVSLVVSSWGAETDLLRGLGKDAINVMTASGKDALAYSDSDQFDFDLRSGLARKYPIVTVNLAGEVAATPSTSNPQQFDLRLGERLQRWTYKVKDSGGRAVLCPANTQQGVLSFLLSLFRFAYPAIRAWKLYQPTKDYDVIVYVDKKATAAAEGQAATDSYSVPKVEFRYRWTDETKAQRTTLPCTPIQTL